ncbi:MIP/aquaporin family protein [Corynebacterium mendelii]|uniref:Aquaporin family protein n=1 Tax=Corynebacterium mendelii TaxID=2765362 RepID=A0A939IYH0_9CORY|nr:MIP/aquaporin family protein [Corynebacterium mendelii]MBN9645113.1 aquaporin family protein [Corynebacterium mendelii]
MHTTLAEIFVSELFGTLILLLIGIGVVANELLPGTKGRGTGWMLIGWGWGFAVFTGVLVAFKSGAHLNPAVTIGIAVSGAPEYVPGIPVDTASTATYLSAQAIGAAAGALVAWLAYKPHYDLADSPRDILMTFCTDPDVRRTPWNFFSEALNTFVLVVVVLSVGPAGQASGLVKVDLGLLGALGVALLVTGIVLGLGGTTGCSINPTRDLMPRLVHAVLPIANKGSSRWDYAWVPVIGPVVGGILAGLVAPMLF